MNKGYLAAVGFFVVIGGFVAVKKARGLRNNNPLNIRENKRTDYDWEGEAAGDFDAEFEEFVAPEYGVRAAVRILRSYARRGVITLEGIISTWAPDSENDTESYIKSVSKKTNIGRFDIVTEKDYPRLLAAMIYHENGSQPYAMSVIEKGIALA